MVDGIFVDPDLTVDKQCDYWKKLNLQRVLLDIYLFKYKQTTQNNVITDYTPADIQIVQGVTV